MAGEGSFCRRIKNRNHKTHHLGIQLTVIEEFVLLKEHPPFGTDPRVPETQLLQFSLLCRVAFMPTAFPASSVKDAESTLAVWAIVTVVDESTVTVNDEEVFPFISTIP